MAQALVGRVDDVSKELWWLWLVRGLVLMVFGFFALVWPGVTLASLTVALGLYIVFSGAVDIIGGIRSIGRGGLWFLTMLLGVLQLGLGVYLLRHLALSLEVFIALIGISFLVKGVMEVASAFTGGIDGGLRFLFAIVGVFSLALGLAMLVQPISSGLAFTWAMGLYGVLAGTFGIATALSLHSALPNRR
jgi:uncharacterized membrane protein HdeD (DUF308 family)